MRTLTTILMTTLLLLPCACGDDAEASRLRDDVGDTVDSIGRSTKKGIEDLSSRLQAGWTDLKAEIAEIKAETEVRGGELKTSIDRALDDAQAKWEAAKQKLDAAREAGADGARDALANAEKAYEAAKAAVAKAWRELGK